MKRTPHNLNLVLTLLLTASLSLSAQAQPLSGQTEPATFLGVELARAPRVVAAQLGLPAGFGLIVAAVQPDSPAAKAGLQPDDILVRYNDQKLVEPSQLSALVRSEKPGTEITLTLLRSGKEQSVKVTLAERQVPISSSQRLLPMPPQGAPFGGFEEFFGFDPFTGSNSGGGLTAPNMTRREDLHATPPPPPSNPPGAGATPPPTPPAPLPVPPPPASTQPGGEQNSSL